MTETYVQPSAEQIRAIRDASIDGPVIMLNLLRFAPNGGREAYGRYGEAAAPFLARHGAKVRYLGDVAATVIGGDEWDEIVLVEYPSRDAFLAMSGDPDYPGDLRSGALLDSRLYCTLEVSN